MTSKIVIPEDVKNKYLERRKYDLVICRKALTAHDFDYLAKLGHQIKGNAITFGFAELGTIAADMEELALKKDIKNLSDVLNRFDFFLNRIKQ